MKTNILIAIMLVLAILAGSCNAPSDNALYREWRLQKYNCIATSSYGLTQVNENCDYVLQLDNTGVFSCTTDCNTISGKFEKSKSALKFSGLSFTELACDDMMVERSIVFNLPCIKSYEITDDAILVLKDDKGHILMELISYDLPDESLCGKWRLEKYNSIVTNSNELTDVNEESGCVLQLNNTGFVCTTDCNIISGNFVENNNILGFSNISMTEKAVEGIVSCDDMKLERSIEANLHCVKSYELKNNTVLYLKDTYGHILMELTKQ